MAGSVNKVILIGNLGEDSEIRRTQDGRPIGEFERGHVGNPGATRRLASAEKRPNGTG